MCILNKDIYTYAYFQLFEIVLFSYNITHYFSFFLNSENSLNSVNSDSKKKVEQFCTSYVPSNFFALDAGASNMHSHAGARWSVGTRNLVVLLPLIVYR